MYEIDNRRRTTDFRPGMDRAEQIARSGQHSVTLCTACYSCHGLRRQRLCRARRAERGLEFGLILVRQRGLQDRAAGALELLQHLVRRGPTGQDEECRAARLHGGGQILHKPVIDAHIRECARDRPGRGAHGQAEQGIQEDQANQGTPKPPLTAPVAVRLTAWCNLIFPA
jgi:hypothetical protein